MNQLLPFLCFGGHCIQHNIQYKNLIHSVFFSFPPTGTNFSDLPIALPDPVVEALPELLPKPSVPKPLPLPEAPMAKHLPLLEAPLSKPLHGFMLGPILVEPLLKVPLPDKLLADVPLVPLVEESPRPPLPSVPLIEEPAKPLLPDVSFAKGPLAPLDPLTEGTFLLDLV